MAARALASVAATACAMFLTPVSSDAALVAFQNAVTADGPYEYYRFGESGIATGSTASDTSGNGHTGTYFFSPTGGQPTAGDGAVLFNGSSQYLLSSSAGTSSTSFGSVANLSSYEFIFKTNSGFSTTTYQSLFGTYNTGTAGNTLAISVDLNTPANNASPAAANTTRIFVRGNDGDSVGYSFFNSSLYNGNYHHLVLTFNGNASGAAAFAAYVDGTLQTNSINFAQISSDPTDTPDSDPDGFATLGFNPTYGARNVAGSIGQFANITLDEAAIYPTVLSPAQVAAHAAVPEPGTIGVLGALGIGTLLSRRRRV